MHWHILRVSIKRTYLNWMCAKVAHAAATTEFSAKEEHMAQSIKEGAFANINLKAEHLKLQSKETI